MSLEQQCAQTACSSDTSSGDPVDLDLDHNTATVLDDLTQAEFQQWSNFSGIFIPLNTNSSVHPWEKLGIDGFLFSLKLGTALCIETMKIHSLKPISDTSSNFFLTLAIFLT